jgi:hypothetical protein
VLVVHGVADETGAELDLTGAAELELAGAELDGQTAAEAPAAKRIAENFIFLDGWS